MPYHRARVRSNEVGRNNAEEGGREDLPKTGKNDEGFEETVKERSRGLDASRTESRSDAGRRNVGGENGERPGPIFADERQSTPQRGDENKGEIDRFSCKLQ